MLKGQYPFTERSPNSAATGYDTETEYRTASEYDTASEFEHGEDGPLSDTDQARTTRHKKEFLRACVVPVLHTCAC